MLLQFLYRYQYEDEHDDYDTPEDKLTGIAEKLVRQRCGKEQAYINATPNSKRKFDVKFGKYVTGCYQEEQDKPINTNPDLPDGQVLVEMFVQQAQREFEASHAIAPELDREEWGGLME